VGSLAVRFYLRSFTFGVYYCVGSRLVSEAPLVVEEHRKLLAVGINCVAKQVGLQSIATQ
jgi:hypothetical protein